MKIKCTIICLIISLGVMAGETGSFEIKKCYKIDGYWSNWEEEYCRLYFDWNKNSIELIEYDFSAHPSQYMWRVYVDVSTKRVDDEGWEVYDGTFEYYITDTYPTIKSILLNKKWIDPTKHDVTKGQTPCKKIKSHATIKYYEKKWNKKEFVGYNFWGYAKYKDIKKTSLSINIYFDGVGYGISWGYK